MMNLQSSALDIASRDFLPWAALVDEGIILKQDGSLQRTCNFRGLISISAVPSNFRLAGL